MNLTAILSHSTSQHLKSQVPSVNTDLEVRVPCFAETILVPLACLLLSLMTWRHCRLGMTGVALEFYFQDNIVTTRTCTLPDKYLLMSHFIFHICC